MPTTEQITNNNKTENQKAREYLEEHPDARVGKINWYSDQDKRIKKLANIKTLLNFSYDFAVPQEDKELFKMIKDYNNEPDFTKPSVNVTQIFDRIDKVNGISFYWV